MNSEDPPTGVNIQSPVILDNLEDESRPFHNIKSNFQYASGNKFDANSNRILLE